MNLSKHFTLEELTRSDVAKAHGINNEPTPDAMTALWATAQMLELIRKFLSYWAGQDVPLLISSGYRSPALNHAVGSKPTSDHIKGMAADFTAPTFGPPDKVATYLASRINGCGIGQLIYEEARGKEWVHVSTAIPVRQENRIITIRNGIAAVGIARKA